MISWTGLMGGKGTVSEKLLHGHVRFSPGCRPVVVWNLTRRCNLKCIHCYQESDDQAAESAVPPSQTGPLLKDLARVGVKILLLSGGEPLLRRDLSDIIEQAVRLGIRPALSTNGTLMDEKTASRLKSAGLAYAGVSVDGLQETHDRFRGEEGAYERAWLGIRAAQSAGLPVGVRFTLTSQNVQDLEGLLNRVEEERIPRFCMYHLVYAGRGKQDQHLDVDVPTRRQVADLLFRRAGRWASEGQEMELLTVDNHADGVYLVQRLKEVAPERAELAKRILTSQIGCPAGCKIACISPSAMVHACQFWTHERLGSLSERDFSEIWEALEGNPLRERDSLLKGRCGRCVHKAYCGGCRIRAQHVYGDPWAEDPSCHLTDEEILQTL